MLSLLRLVFRKVLASRAAKTVWLSRVLVAVSVIKWIANRRAPARVIRLRKDEVMLIDVAKNPDLRA